MSPKDNGPISTAASNGAADIAELRQECEQLRLALAAANKERDDYRAMLYAHLRASITEEEKARMEADLRDVIDNGGVSFREVLDEIMQEHRSK